MSIVFVLIAGKRCVGKDTVALYLKKRLGRCAIVRAFAYYPKKKYADMQSLPLDRLLYDRDFKELHRSAIIDLAMSARARYADVWVNDLYNDTLCMKELVVIVPDFRFPNEHDYLLNCRGVKCVTVCVQCSDNTRKKRGWKYDKDIDNSESETALDGYRNFDIVLQNDGTREELQSSTERGFSGIGLENLVSKG